MSNSNLSNLAILVRYNILNSTTTAGSGHPTSSLSATDVMTALMFGGYFKGDLDDPNFHNNDRLIFSKGHAAPLLYSLYAVAGAISSDELLTLRKLGSRLEGHPTMRFPFTEAATGSLGCGLAIGVGMALNAKYEGLDYKTYVLMGDSETAEGSVWESMNIASHYKLNNLVGIIDVNRLGQRGETIDGWNIETYKLKSEAFGWETFVVDGHDIEQIVKTLDLVATSRTEKPKMVLAKTKKGAGISFLENKDGWHGKALDQKDYEKAATELGDIDFDIKGTINKPKIVQSKVKTRVLDNKKPLNYTLGENIATRKAYGQSLTLLGSLNEKVIVLDAETSNSTFADIFKNEFPERFFEMYIAEQNMVGTALGFSRRGKIPFVSTFAAFFSRAYDQIRMSQYSNPNIKFVGSHCGVSIGVDGSSQMALEDLAMMRAVSEMIVFYPSDGLSTQKLVFKAAAHAGNVYIRTTRGDTPIIYQSDEEFIIGGSKTLRTSEHDIITIIAAGITLHEALKAYDQLKEQEIIVRVVDLYCVKPVDKSTLVKAMKETQALIVVEDHYEQGGIYGAVTEALGEIESATPVYSLSVKNPPQSGTPAELLRYSEIDAKAIIDLVTKISK
jgi:transketolase